MLPLSRCECESSRRKELDYDDVCIWPSQEIQVGFAIVNHLAAVNMLHVTAGQWTTAAARVIAPSTDCRIRDGESACLNERYSEDAALAGSQGEDTQQA